jgi:hypothetical protein
MSQPTSVRPRIRGRGGKPRREARALDAEGRHQQGYQMGDEPDLREERQRHAGRQGEKGGIAPGVGQGNAG